MSNISFNSNNNRSDQETEIKSYTIILNLPKFNNEYFGKEFWSKKHKPLRASFETNWTPDLCPDFWGSKVPKELNTSEFWNNLIEQAKLTSQTNKKQKKRL